jgi:hypothetical protein
MQLCTITVFIFHEFFIVFFLSLQRMGKFASLYLRAKILSNFFRPPSPNYSDSFLYFTQTYDLYSYELEQLASSDDGYRV